MNSTGAIKLKCKQRFVSEALASWPVGLEFQHDDPKIWFADICLGVTDRDFSSPFA